MTNLLSVDELILHIRQRNEEALNMLLFRYRDIRDILIWETLKRNRYCGLEFDDMQQAAHEATLLVIETYDPRKSCFYAYWKLIVARELQTFLRKHNGLSASILNTAYSFDGLDEFERNYCFSQSIEVADDSLVESINQAESVVRLAEAAENGLTPHEKAVMAYRMLGYSYEEIAETLHFTNRKLCRVMLSMRSKMRDLSKDWM